MRAPRNEPRVVATYVSKKPYVTSEVTRFANVRGGEHSLWFAASRINLSTRTNGV